MKSEEIKKLSNKKLNINNLDEIKKEYEISYGEYDYLELKKAINNESPFFIKNYFVIGHENDEFITDTDKKIKIERMVKAVIVEDIKEALPLEKTGDFFVIIGKNKWDTDIDEFMSILGDLRVGETFLPPLSAIFNFMIPSEKEIKEKVVSYIEGVQVNIFSKDNYIDNAIHEIGHLFWRECLNHEEKMSFKHHFEFLKPACIFEYSWEKSDEEEVFATIYKWYIKSLLLNPSFGNILEHEDPEGLKLIQGVIDRIAKDKIIKDVFELGKTDLLDYLNPKFDVTTGCKVRKKGLFDKVKDIELPDDMLNDIDRFEDGVTYINLNKAIIPLKGNKIDWEVMEKSKK